MCGFGPPGVFKLQNASGLNKLAGMRTLFIVWLLAIAGIPALGAGETCPVTNVLQLQLAGLQPGPTNCSFHLEGDVWWANPAANQLVLHDTSGTEELEMDLQGRPVRAGQKVRIEGNGAIARIADGYRLGVIGPVVDNNGAHSMTEKSGAVFLTAGRQPLRVDWFNGTYEFGLEVDWQGPDLPRQKIPDAALFRHAAGDEAGLDYSVFDAPGEVLPDFSRVMAIQSGAVSNFDLGILPRTEHVGVRFTGELAVPRTGLYTFFTKSDDGSELFVGLPSVRLTDIGEAVFPRPRRIVLGQTLAEADDFQWAEVEGTAAFASETAGGLELDLSSDIGRIRLEISDRAGLSAAQLLDRQIRATGVCKIARTTDGQRVADTLLVPDAREIELLESAPPVFPVGSTNATRLSELITAAEVHRLKREDAQRGYPVKMQGVVTCVMPEHQAFTLQDSTRGIYVEDHSTSRAFLPQIGEFLEVTGTTDPSLFAPIVKAQSFTSLGAGHLPDPVRPTWDQLLNGSLDAQYVELQGIITAVTATNVTLLTRDGRINVELRVTGAESESLARYEDALVQVRGCLLANWDYVTHEVKVGESGFTARPFPWISRCRRICLPFPAKPWQTCCSLTRRPAFFSA